MVLSESDSTATLTDAAEARGEAPLPKVKRRQKGSNGVTPMGKQKNGLKQFRLRIFLGTKPGTKNQPIVKQKTVWAKNQTAAEKMADQLKTELKGVRRDTSSRTVDDLLDAYADYQISRRRAPGTVHETRRTKDKVVGPVLGHIDITKLTVEDLDGFYARMTSGDENHRPQAPSSVLRYHQILHGALEMARGYHWIPENPADRAKGRPEVTEPEIRVPTPRQVQRYVEEALRRNELYGVLTLLAVLTAARRGEFCALRWQHIQPDSSFDEVQDENEARLLVVRIRRALYRAGAERGEKETKGTRQRSVPVNDELARVLLWWREKCEKTASDHGVTLVPDAFVVSPLPDGSRPVNPDTLSTFQGKLAKELGIALEGRNPFRHWGGTEISGQGTSPVEGANLLGYQDIKTFLQRYTHPTTPGQGAAAALLGRGLSLDALGIPEDPTATGAAQPGA